MVFGFLKNIGRVPEGYNAKVHGAFDPSVFYGKKDIPLAEVKVGELGGWLARRNKNPIAMSQCMARAWWRWQFKYVHPKRAKLVPVVQLVVATIALFYVINYEHLKYHKHYKYHW